MKNSVLERKTLCLNALHFDLQGEIIDNYVTELKIKVASCEYGDLTDSVIRNQVVLNVNDLALQEHLIGITELSFDKVVQKIKCTESTHEQVIQINSGKEDNFAVNQARKLSN